MSLLVLGKIENGKLNVLNIQCKNCGVVYSVDTFNNTALCQKCFKEDKNEKDN